MKFFLFCLLAICLLQIQTAQAQKCFLQSESNCWEESYGRGVGTPIDSCPSGNERNGELCYPNCPSGYKGDGPVCWQTCPPGFNDNGAFCGKTSYTRSTYSIIHEKKCNDENPQGCEKGVGVYYPKCRSGFKGDGPVCWAICQNGMKDIGVSCAKASQTRGAGTPLVCSPDKQYDAGLCYNPCKSYYSGVGPVCWGSCPNGMSKCGALCVTDPSECTGTLANIGEDVGKAILGFILSGASPIGAAVSVGLLGDELANDLNYPQCGN